MGISINDQVFQHFDEHDQKSHKRIKAYQSFYRKCKYLLSAYKPKF